MADQSDVEAAIRTAVQAVRTGLAASWPVYRGYPSAAVLDGDLAGNSLVVTIYPRQGFTRNTTRYLGDSATTYPAPTLTVAQAGNVFTFSGAGGTNHVAGVVVGTYAYSYRMLPGDTPASVATALAALIVGATASGATLTVTPGEAYLETSGGQQIEDGSGHPLIATGVIYPFASSTCYALTGADATLTTELGNIEQQFCVALWCALPTDRDAIGSAITAALAAIPRLALSDGSIGRMRFAGSMSSDKGEAASLYRRDIYVSVDYETTATTTVPIVLFPGFNTNSVRVGALHP